MPFLPTIWGSVRSPSAAIQRVLVATGSALVGVALLAVARPDRMLVERVEFVGAERAGLAELRHLSDVRNGTTIWGVDLRAVHEGVIRHPWVRSATVRRAWPDAVIVEVEEYEPVAVLRQDELFYVDASGDVFLRARPDDLDYPVISGTRDLERVHPDLPGLVVGDALWLIDELDRRDLAPRDVLSEVVFSRTRGFTVLLVGGAEIRFGPEGLPRQVDRLATLRAEGVDLGRPVLVDLAPASVAIVREIPAPGEG